MSEMIERIAKAMAENAGFSWEHCAQSQWKSDARVGIEAMRKPSQLMLDACDMNIPTEGDITRLWITHIWSDMIEAALGQSDDAR